MTSYKFKYSGKTYFVDSYSSTTARTIFTNFLLTFKGLKMYSYNPCSKEWTRTKPNNIKTKNTLKVTKLNNKEFLIETIGL